MQLQIFFHHIMLWVCRYRHCCHCCCCYHCCPSGIDTRGSTEPVMSHLAQIGRVVLENSIIYQRMGGW